mgnify:CR=1 FL=1
MLLPYMTNLDPDTGAWAAAQAWYDELIISTQRIADASARRTTPVSTGSFPAWRREQSRSGSSSGIPLQPTWVGDKPYPRRSTCGNRLAAGPDLVVGREQRFTGSAQNAAFRIDLAADNPRWLMLNPGSPQSAVTNAPLRTTWMDCRCIAAHLLHDANSVSRPPMPVTTSTA